MLKINEMYPCVLGESLQAGLPALLIRLSDCNLACTYCDSEYSRREPGRAVSIEELAEAALAAGFGRVLLTGGEPMLQEEEAVQLMARLVAQGIETLLETNGTLPLDQVPRGVIKVVDVKTPGALGEQDLPLDTVLDNLSLLSEGDQLKFVLLDRRDYEWTCAFLREHDPGLPPGSVLLSPAWGSLQPAALADWMLADGLAWRFHLQVHKAVWGDRRGV